MLVIASYNLKGGVGKTAAAVNLAYLSAFEGNRTLIWDLDPQGAASFYFRIQANIQGGGSRLFNMGPDLNELIKGTNYERLDLLPADFSYRNMDLMLSKWKSPDKQIGRILSHIKDRYDVVILDCAPNISLASDSIFRAANVILVPTIPTILSFRALQQVIKYMEESELDISRVYPFFSMVDRRRTLHRNLVETVQDKPVPFLKTTIPYSSDIEKMGVKRTPICESFSAAGSQCYVMLWKELKERCQAADLPSNRLWDLIIRQELVHKGPEQQQLFSH